MATFIAGATCANHPLTNALFPAIYRRLVQANKCCTTGYRTDSFGLLMTPELGN